MNGKWLKCLLSYVLTVLECDFLCPYIVWPHSQAVGERSGNEVTTTQSLQGYQYTNTTHKELELAVMVLLAPE